MTKNGIRVVAVMNRKGGCGKSTLVKGLASAAADRGELVTVFDTDQSRNIAEWMKRGRATGNWSDDVEVIHTLEVGKVLDTIDEIYEQPDQEHLILIDTFGGGSEAQDLLAGAAHLIISPCMLSEGDIRETTQTGLWYVRLKERADQPDTIPPYKVVVSRVPNRLSEPDKANLKTLFTTLPVMDEFVSNRSAYIRMDQGLLGRVRDNLVNRGVAAHVQDALSEMSVILDSIDHVIQENSDATA